MPQLHPLGGADQTVSHLHILKLASAEDEHQAEARFLLDETIAQARKVFDQVSAAILPPEEPLPVTPPGDAVLLVGARNVLVGEGTLGAMADGILDGHDLAVPHRLSEVDPLRDHPVFTLRGFERVEAMVLAQEPDPGPVPLTPLPLSMSSAAWYRRALAGHQNESLVNPPEALSRVVEEARRVQRGVCHEFIDYYGESREDILPFVPEGVETVLEIGCGRGGTAEILERRYGCRVTGVELNPVVAAEAAQRMHRVIQGDIETLEIDGAFDLVLALEVIEHLVDPDAFLRRAATLARKGGRIVLSTPNVGHYSLVEDLMAGRWDYMPGGAMCSTHVRFFTRHTLERMLHRVGFRRLRITGQPTELPDRWRTWGQAPGLDTESLSTLAFYVVVDL